MKPVEYWKKRSEALEAALLQSTSYRCPHCVHFLCEDYDSCIDEHFSRWEFNVERFNNK